MDRFRIQKTRQQEGYVVRNIKRKTLAKVEPIKPSKSSHNSTQDENYADQSDIFYHHLEQLKKEYRDFFGAVEEYGNMLSQNSREPLLEKVESWILVYNRVIDSILQLDRNFHTNHAIRIRAFLKDYEGMFMNLGIRLDEANMVADIPLLRQKLEEDEEKIREVFRTKAQWMLLLYTEFLRIKTILQTKKRPEPQTERGKGLLFDTKR